MRGGHLLRFHRGNGVEHDNSVRVCNFKVALLDGVMHIFEYVLQFANKGVV